MQVRHLPRLSSPGYEIPAQSHVFAVVIGSGYGGAITASRLARAGLPKAGKDVWLLERGRELHPGEFPDTPAEALGEFQFHLGPWHVGRRTALYDMRARGDMNVFVGCGLGGTSLINANVALRATPGVFEHPAWPEDLRNDLAALEEGYKRAEDMLAPRQLPESIDLRKLRALETSATALGGTFYRPPINVTFDGGANAAGIHQPGCTACGDCIAGCNTGAKNTVLMNYLPDAVAHGAKIYTEVAVHHLSREDDHWVVHYEVLETGQELFGAPHFTLMADLVVLSAGTLGSTEILLRSRDDLALCDALGTRFTGNGDVLAFSYNGDNEVDGIGWGSIDPDDMDAVGPCITGVIDLRDGPVDEGMVVEEGSIPGGLAPVLPQVFAAAAAARLGHDTDDDLRDEAIEFVRQADSLIRGPYVGAVDNTLTYLVMAHDGSDGKLELDDGHVTVTWEGVGERPLFDAIDAKLLSATQPLGGTFLPNPLGTDRFGNRLITVHPLGGCPMGNDGATGVVNHKGQVFQDNSGDVYDSLYVADGSVIPRSLGVNPLLTISALAERTAALMARDRDWTIDYDSPTPEIPPRPPTPVGIQFTERMAGWVATGADIPDDFGEAADLGKAADSSMEFVFTIVADDLDEFLDDPERQARMVGSVVLEALSRQPMAADGEFNLLVRNADVVGLTNMQYRARLTSADGARYFLLGHKDIRNDKGFDIWSDTTTLFTTVYAGTDDSGPVVARGVLTIALHDFVQQLRSIRATGTDDLAEQLKAKARFGKEFASKLFAVYGGVAAGSALPDHDAPPRKKRPLRAPQPSLHPFTTEDGVELLLTRYRGGAKGPVLVTHGLGVSSLIFTIDTIGTNLVEYLCANGYDVWLLDFRASTALPAARTQFTADDVAAQDYPAAVEEILRHTGAADVQVVAHCFGSTTFICAMLSGLEHVRSAVCSQIATHIKAPFLTRVKSGMYVPNVLEAFGFDTLSADAHTDEGRLERVFDRALDLWPDDDEEECDNAVCHRITFLYGLLYEHDQLNTATHEAGLGEMFGVANISAFKHLALMVRRGAVAGADGSDRYMPHLDRLAIPLKIIHGAENVCFLPKSTKLTIDALTEANGPERYTRDVIPNYGHIDCIFGKNAARDVYPKILAGLEPTATP